MLSAWAVYLAVFSTFYRLIGMMAPALAALPVILTAWSLGIVPGIISALLSFLLNILMLMVLQPSGLQGIFTGTGLTSSILNLIIGFLFGWMSDLQAQIKNELAERRHAEQVLQQSQQLLAKTFASLREALFLVDANTNKIVDCNPAASDVFGYHREEMVGRTTAFLHVDQAALEEFGERLSSDVEKKGFLFLPEFSMKRKDGQVFPTEHSVMPLNDKQGNLVGWVSVVRDISERKRMEEELWKMSIHDVLTGLYNRRFFEEEMARLDRGRRFPISIIIGDLNNLKETNDRDGHAAGDALLQRTAQVLTIAFRVEDIIARIGGDEFAVLLPHTSGPAAGEALRRLRCTIREHNAAHGGIPISIALGVSTAEKNLTLAEAFKEADAQMYKDKHSL
ncbi:MAG: diguanylate cyclase [Chloroflexota bacterium]